MQRSEMAAKIFSENLWLLRKWKSVILPEHALKGNGDKLVIEFLSTLEFATSWLDIRQDSCRVIYEEEVEKMDADASARDSLNFLQYSR